LSASIRFENVVKAYGQNVIIPGLSLTVRDGEFFTLLGPSGCGKTTLLRMAAGFNSIEGGDIFFGEERVNDMPPSRRNIGMVFQNYAVFPHMTVRQNVAFGLENRPLDKAERAARVDQILETVKITEFQSRMPERLSGGQQQRVSLARAIVIHPNLLLMDEPLSNLDAKLRVEMRNAIKQIQREVHITTIYVTHDQEEAMAVSDRIAVMNLGQIQQVGTPKELYQRPASLFVAGFIGQSDTLNAQLQCQGNQTLLVFENGYTMPYPHLREECRRDAPVKVSVRPEEFVLNTRQEGLPGTIVSSVFLGLNTTYFVRLWNGETVELVEESSVSSLHPDGTPVSLTLKADKINVFNEGGTENLSQGVKNDAS
jgi:iron(III) transport system ATP-binding protein